MRHRARLWVAARRIAPERSDEDVAADTRRVAKAIAQTLANRAYRRPSLSSESPHDSAVEQRAYDRETIDRYRDHIAPEVEELREEYLARGVWRPDLDARWRDPETVVELRALLIDLSELADEL